MAKLTSVPKGAVRTRRMPRELKARQVMSYQIPPSEQHPEGGEGLLLVDDETGRIYLRSDNGWVPYDMMEALDDTTV